MDVPPTSSKTRRAFEDLAEELAGRGVTLSTMFGVPTLKAKGKALGSLWGDAIVFKLPPAELDVTLQLKGAHAFDPMGGRPMKEWAVVPAAHAKRWRSLAEASFAYVTGGRA